MGIDIGVGLYNKDQVYTRSDRTAIEDLNQRKLEHSPTTNRGSDIIIDHVAQLSEEGLIPPPGSHLT